MKKGQKIVCAALIAALTAGSAVSLVACQTPLTDEPLKGTVIADYTKTADDRKETFASGSKGYSWENGEPFNVWWKPDLVTYDGGKMSLALGEMTTKEQKWDAETDTMVDVVADYYGAESRTEHYYGFGDYEVRMKPAKIAGTASTFFTCTGPYDVWYEEDGETVKKTNHHDEIDIEFLGKDTTKVQFNYFANGVGGHEYMYNLGFDASKEFHNYGYRWTKEYITWFVDGKPVYRVDRANIKQGESWPEDPGRMIMNYWCGTKKAQGWMGEFKNDYSGKAEYEWVKSSAEQQPDPNTAHIKDNPPVDDLDVPTEGWTDIDYSGFGGWNGYTIDKTDGLTISHTEAKSGYACEGMSMANSYSWVKFKIKNNDVTNAADLRIDIKKEGGKGGVEAVSPANEKVSVNATDSAVMIKLAASEELDIAVKIKDMYVDQFVVFLNSMDSTSAAAGSVTISGLQGIVNGEVTPPEPPADSKVKIGDNEVAFAGGGYTVTASEDGSSMTVEYADVKGNGYGNINTSIAEFVADNNAFTVTIKNEGEQTVKIRIDIGCDAVNGSDKNDGTKNNFCNISAEYDDDTVVKGNDYVYGGGDWMQLASGKTVTVKLTFTANVAKDIKFYMDSSTWDDETTHSGKVVFSNMSLSKVTVEQPEPPEPPVTPVDGWTAIDYSGFGGWDQYTVDKTNGLTISHDEAKGGYKCCGMDLASDYGVVKFTIKNNAEVGAVVKIDIKKKGVVEGDNGVGGASAVTFTGGVEGDNVYVNDYDYSVVIVIAAGSELEVTVTIKDEVEVDQFVVFLNSTGDEKAGATGSITISELQGKAKATPPAGEALTFTSTDVYTVDKTGEEATEITVAYTEVTGSTYKNVAANVATLAADKNTFSIKITNNGTEAVTVRIDLIGENTVTVGGNKNMNVCNLSATAVGGTNLHTETEWGGTYITIAAGESATVVITYSNDSATGAVQRVQLYLDSAVNGDTATHAGNVTFGEFVFSATESEPDQE